MYTRLKEFKAIIKPYNYTCRIDNNCFLDLVILYKTEIICFICAESISTKSKNWLSNLIETIETEMELNTRQFQRSIIELYSLHSILEGELRKRKLKSLLK